MIPIQTTDRKKEKRAAEVIHGKEKGGSEKRGVTHNMLTK